MRRIGPTMRIMSLITICCFMNACTIAYLPEKFATINEAFPESVAKEIPVNVPQYASCLRVDSYEAPFEDVWRAVTVSLTQAQLSIQSSQKAKGYILANRVTGRSGFRGEFWYAIAVKEQSSKTTEVVIASKSQGTCKIYTPVFYFVAVLGIFTIPFIPMAYSESKQCEEVSSVPHWAGGVQNEEILRQVSIFTRNNLIAAGAL